MHTLVLFHASLLTASADGKSADGHAVMVLGAAGLLVFAFMSMRRAVGPFIEILKSALFAMVTFLLIAVAVVLLLISMIR